MTSPPEHPCADCGQLAPRVKKLPEGGLCRRCYNARRREECSRCRQLRTPNARTADGAPLCGYCARPQRACAGCGRTGHVTAVIDGVDLCQRCYQAPIRACGGCGKERRVAVRSQAGRTDLCKSCYRTRGVECAVCHRTRPVHTTTWPVGPVCAGCYRNVLRNPRTCASCAQHKVLIGASETGKPICGPCAGVTRDYVCATCGASGEQHFEQTCLRCSIIRGAEQLLAAATGAIPEALAGLPAALAQRGRPDSTMRWLLRPTSSALLQAIGAQTAITHAGVDACPPGQARHYLRSFLVDAGILPCRDEHLERLGTWVDELLLTIPPHQAAIISPYARWRILRAVRRRTRRSKATSVGVAGSARERIRTAVRLLAHLDRNGESIESLSQESLDGWTRGNSSRCSDIAPFIRWLDITGITHDLRVEVQMQTEPSDINPEDVHRTLIQNLISGEQQADLVTRVAGLLILLYGARTERLHRLTTADITTVAGRTCLTIATDPVELPSPVAQLVGELATTAARSPNARTRTGEDSYLFASPRRPHEPLHPTTLGRKLASAGIHPQITRNTAMLALTSDLPAAIIATQLGLTPQTTTKWAQFAQRDNMEYIVARAHEMS